MGKKKISMEDLVLLDAMLEQVEDMTPAEKKAIKRIRNVLIRKVS